MNKWKLVFVELCYGWFSSTKLVFVVSKGFYPLSSDFNTVSSVKLKISFTQNEIYATIKHHQSEQEV